MRVTTKPGGALAGLEQLEPRVLLAAEGFHAVAIEFDPATGIRFGAAVAAADVNGGAVSFDDALRFTFNHGPDDSSIHGFTFLGQGGSFDFGITFGAGGDRFDDRTSVGAVDGRLGFTFARTEQTGAWSLIVLAPYELRDPIEPNVAGQYAASAVMQHPDSPFTLPILATGSDVIGGQTFLGDYIASNGLLDGIADTITKIEESGRIQLASSGMAMVGLGSQTVFASGVDAIDGVITAGFRRNDNAPAVTASMLEGLIYGVALIGNELFFDPAGQVPGMPFEAARASLRFFADGVVERYDIDPEFVPFNPPPDATGTYTVKDNNIVEIVWEGTIVNRFEVSSDLTTLVPVVSMNDQQRVDFGFGLGFRTAAGATPPGDPGGPGDNDPPDTPEDPDDGEGNPPVDDPGGNPGDPDPPPPMPFTFTDMEAVSSSFDESSGRIVLFVEAGGMTPSFAFVDLTDALGVTFLDEPAVSLTGDGSTIFGIGVTSQGPISFASRANGTFVFELVLGDGELAPGDAYTGAVRATQAGVIETGARFANTNQWFAAIGRNDAVDLFEALGDVDSDGIIEFQRTSLFDTAIMIHGDAPAPTDHSTLLYTPWGSLAYIYRSTEGEIWSIWVHQKELGGVWYANNLTAKAGASRAAPGAIAAAATSWGAIHIGYTGIEGDLRQLWWEYRRNRWEEHWTGQLTGAPNLRQSTLAIRADAESASIVITGIGVDSSRLLEISWDAATDLWRPRNIGEGLGILPQANADLAYTRTRSGRVNLVGEIEIGTSEALASISGPKRTLLNGAPSMLTFDYVVTPLLELVLTDIKLDKADLAIHEKFELPL